MLFGTEVREKSFYQKESYKERNLYYKIFAGCLFNELLPEYLANKTAFFDLLISHTDAKRYVADNVPLKQVLSELARDQIHVTFDFHPMQIIKNYTDRGEVSDIIIWGDNYFLSIEAKYLSGWSFKKDITEVQQRIKDVGEKVNKQGIQVLLIQDKKLENAKSKVNQSGSNYKELYDQLSSLPVPVLVITWEEVKGIIKNQSVNDYLSEQLRRKVNQSKLSINEIL